MPTIKNTTKDFEDERGGENYEGNAVSVRSVDGFQVSLICIFLAAGVAKGAREKTFWFRTLCPNIILLGSFGFII